MTGSNPGAMRKHSAARRWRVKALGNVLTALTISCAGSEHEPASASPSFARDGKTTKSVSPPDVAPPVAVSGSRHDAVVPNTKTEDASVDRGCTQVEAEHWLASKGRYQWSGATYPQIAQGDEYAPIQAIQTLYVEASGSNRPQPFGVDNHFECKAEVNRILIASPAETVTIGLVGNEVKIGNRSYSNTPTFNLFDTLVRVLSDLAGRCQHQGIRGSRSASHAYKDGIVIEFGYRPLVVQLVGLSNGSANPERLYVLDVIGSGQSSLWK